MAYFSNGEEGDIYEDRYCRNCVHDESCAVILLHLTWNYEQNKDAVKKEALEILIPTSGYVNLKCTMFWGKDD